MSAEVVFAHEGINEAIRHLCNAHPKGGELLRPLLAYVGMFAPVKTEMRRDRVAALLRELVPMINAGTVRDKHCVTHAAPLEYWRQALDEMIARRDTGDLQLPLKSHGYLQTVVVGLASKAAATAERNTEAQRAGHAGMGTQAERVQAVTVDAPKRSAPSPEIRQNLLRAAGSRRAENQEATQ
ncbi:hypothetical protein [Ralstonia sp. ASV6]|uniref:hypothetical protein n=1 Tax=Ralstonia sp. ASV6 TaxID=2795124 RepID=UPI001E546EF6|nr:hypothetical protein [Ralstonia sp. ASV6]